MGHFLLQSVNELWLNSRKFYNKLMNWKKIKYLHPVK